MPLLYGLELAGDDAGGIVAIGNFDGVHRGHQQMLGLLRQRADQRGAPAVVLTFDPHPLRILRPEFAPPSLCTLEQKAELLQVHGVDAVVVVPAVRELLSLSPEAFFEDVIRDKLRARGLVEGPNFRFGKDRAGDVAMLRSLCTAAGMTCDVVEPVEIDGEMISSSAIREQVADGGVETAAKWLGRPYQIRGRVDGGARRGRILGFPTANLAGVETLIPADGVYAGRVAFDGESHLAAVNIGPNPTFGDERRKVEVHLLDFDGDLYGEPLSVDILARIRDVKRFADSAALEAQIRADLKAVRAVAEGPAYD